jgi:hypothetical protein
MDIESPQRRDVAERIDRRPPEMEVGAHRPSERERA